MIAYKIGVFCCRGLTPLISLSLQHILILFPTKDTGCLGCCPSGPRTGIHSCQAALGNSGSDRAGWPPAGGRADWNVPTCSDVLQLMGCCICLSWDTLCCIPLTYCLFPFHKTPLQLTEFSVMGLECLILCMSCGIKITTMYKSDIFKEVFQFLHCVHFKSYEPLSKAEKCAGLHFCILG